LLVNAAATWLMCGVIWLVQLVHYPLFEYYDAQRYRAAMDAHQRRTGWVVFPPMFLELLTALALLAWPPVGVPAWSFWFGAALVGVWGFSTILVQVPLHNRLLAGGFAPALHSRLVTSNWLRTAAWSVRGVLCGLQLAVADRT
jgi:hypothetical protein